MKTKVLFTICSVNKSTVAVQRHGTSLVTITFYKKTWKYGRSRYRLSRWSRYADGGTEMSWQNKEYMFLPTPKKMHRKEHIFLNVQNDIDIIHAQHLRRLIKNVDTNVTFSCNTCTCMPDSLKTHDNKKKRYYSGSTKIHLKQRLPIVSKHTHEI